MTRPWTRPSRASSTASSSTRARSAAPAAGLFVQESIDEPFIERLKDRLSTLRVGDPLDKNTDVGAINNAAQLAKIEELIEAGVAEGAEIYQPACELPARGFFVRPTLFTNVAQSNRIAQEEIFGPVLSVLTFRTPAEAIEKANNTPYGLSAGVWTEKGSRILSMVKQLRAGVVWANTFNRFDPTSPFGGYKESGFGREGGRHGLLAYLDTGRGTDRGCSRRTPAAAGTSANVALAPESASRYARPTSSTSGGRSRARSRGARTWSAPRTARRSPTPSAAHARTCAMRSRAARSAFPGWGGRTAMNRGQVLYRVAELMEGRRDQFVAEVAAAEGLSRRGADEQVDRAIDRWVWYAGWADKIAPGAGHREPGGGRLLRLHLPGGDRRGRHRSAGELRRCSASSRAWRRWSSAATPRWCWRRRRHPLPAVTLAEVLATSDVPGGVINLITGHQRELVPWLAAHMDVNGLDLFGVPPSCARRSSRARWTR